ncbi:MAG: sugar ABC transporter permease [Lachnospiraceae bacterium]|nr:sugar ABC transporter permease [Lachnospiraceae bacterium]
MAKAKEKIRRPKYEGLQKKKAVAGYLFILPFIIGFLGFMVKPLIQSFYMSICKVVVDSTGFTFNPNGIQNYYNAFRLDIEFSRFLTESLSNMVINTISVMVFSLFVAILLNQKFKGRAFVRAIFFLPVILSSGVILGVETNNALLGDMADMIKENSTDFSITDTVKVLIQTLGIGTRIFDKVFEIVDKVYDIAIASGIQIIIFLSGLQTISSSMYEAASIEGCTAWESFWKITFPMISSLFLVNWIYTIVDFCMHTDNQVMNKIQTELVKNLDYGFSSAMAWIYFIIIIAFIGISSFIISKVVYYYD